MVRLGRMEWEVLMLSEDMLMACIYARMVYMDALYNSKMVYYSR